MFDKVYFFVNAHQFYLHFPRAYEIFENLYIIKETTIFKFDYCMREIKVNKSSNLWDISSFLETS